MDMEEMANTKAQKCLRDKWYRLRKANWIAIPHAKLQTLVLNVSHPDTFSSSATLINRHGETLEVGTLDIFDQKIWRRKGLYVLHSLRSPETWSWRLSAEFLWHAGIDLTLKEHQKVEAVSEFDLVLFGMWT